MDKPILFYDVRVQTSRVTGGTLYLPAIVEREEAVPLDEIIRRAIDRSNPRVSNCKFQVKFPGFV